MAKVKYQLSEAFESRDGSIASTDRFMQNGTLQTRGGTKYVTKRPGNVLFSSLAGVGEPQGVIEYNDYLFTIYDDVLYRSAGSVLSGSTGATWNPPPFVAVPWQGRYGTQAVVFNDRLFVFGGAARTDTGQVNDIWSSTDGITWVQNTATPPWPARDHFRVVVFGDKMYFMGGQSINQSIVHTYYGDVWSSEDGTTWEVVTNSAPWGPRWAFAAVAANNGIFILGGNLGLNTASGEVWFSADGAHWQNVVQATNTFGARMYHEALYFKNRLYVLGGAASSTIGSPLTDVWSSADGSVWTHDNASAFTGVADFGATVYNNKMWIACGLTSGSTRTSNVYSSGDGSTWNLVSTSGLSARSGVALTSFRTATSVNQYGYQTLYLLGGFDGATFLQQLSAGLDIITGGTFPLSPSVAGQEYQMEPFMDGTKLLVKNQSDFWVLEGNLCTKVTDTNYPKETVPGIVVLNLFAYVCTPTGEVRGCKLEDPLHWPSLQFLDADYEDDKAVAIRKYLNFLMVLKQDTTQFFYDAGNPAPGIALAPYPNATMRIGCALAQTVHNVANSVMFIGQTSERAWGVYLLDGFTPTKVSEEWVDLVINANLPGGVDCFVCGVAGHSFYVLSFRTAMRTLVFDLTTKLWSPWITGAGDFPYKYAISDLKNQVDLWIGRGRLNGNIYRTSFGLYGDDGVAFPLVVQTEQLDGDTMQRKFFGRIEMMADQNPGLVTVDVSDDDYGRFDNWGTLDLSERRPFLTRGGSAFRRSFRLTQTDLNPARWEALELTVVMGES